MRLTSQRRLAAVLLDCSPKRVRFASESLPEVKEAITKADIRGLVKRGLIRKVPARGNSRSRIRIFKEQRSKGRRRGHGSRKGTQGARHNPKQDWMSRVRLQRAVLHELRLEKKIDAAAFKELYLKVKGGFFRNRRHLKLYIQEHGMEK